MIASPGKTDLMGNPLARDRSNQTTLRIIQFLVSSTSDFPPAEPFLDCLEDYLFYEQATLSLSNSDLVDAAGERQELIHTRRHSDGGSLCDSTTADDKRRM
jgi:hypothetical protein